MNPPANTDPWHPGQPTDSILTASSHVLWHSWSLYLQLLHHQLSRWLSGKESFLPMQEILDMFVWSLGWEDPWRRKWQSTPVFLPGKFHGQRNLVGNSPWGCRWLDMTEGLVTRTPAPSTSERSLLSLVQCVDEDRLLWVWQKRLSQPGRGNLALPPWVPG